MASIETRPARMRILSSWRALGRMGTHQVPVVVGSVLAGVAGLLTYGLHVARRTAAVVPSTEAVFLVSFGALGVVGYGVSKEDARNGSLVAAVASLGLLVLGGSVGFLMGLVVLAGALWGLVRSS